MARKAFVFTTEHLPTILKQVVIGLVRQDGRDLSVRQMAMLLNVCLEPRRIQTVRGLAAQMEIVKPAVTRCLDRLVELGLARRVPDPADGRSILVDRTKTGIAYVTKAGELLVDAARVAGKEAGMIRSTKGAWM